MINDELYDTIFSCLLQRLRDKFSVVRAQAVQAASRLQDPTNVDCPIIKGSYITFVILSILCRRSPRRMMRRIYLRMFPSLVLDRFSIIGSWRL